MTHRIDASWDTLLKQSKGTAIDYFWSARDTLANSGMEYTAADVIALAAIMAQDFHSTSMGVAVQKLCDTLEALPGAGE